MCRGIGKLVPTAFKQLSSRLREAPPSLSSFLPSLAGDSFGTSSLCGFVFSFPLWLDGSIVESNETILGRHSLIRDEPPGSLYIPSPTTADNAVTNDTIVALDKEQSSQADGPRRNSLPKVWQSLRR
ncbi:hypothetical protein QAD02_022035 [Eretmocerus hayati]|uniref:Uncharacterized protein n=1 Tax=Eretmocerus hayati TaxID=131215 RepID=A0ACC2PRU5_9HYME|nr:hypothetical protein QAD02_022035 [Eretmocerus hayati]